MPAESTDGAMSSPLVARRRRAPPAPGKKAPSWPAVAHCVAAPSWRSRALQRRRGASHHAPLDKPPDCPSATANCCVANVIENNAPNARVFTTIGSLTNRVLEITRYGTRPAQKKNRGALKIGPSSTGARFTGSWPLVGGRNNGEVSPFFPRRSHQRTH